VREDSLNQAQAPAEDGEQRQPEPHHRKQLHQQTSGESKPAEEQVEQPASIPPCQGAIQTRGCQKHQGGLGLHRAAVEHRDWQQCAPEGSPPPSLCSQQQPADVGG